MVAVVKQNKRFLVNQWTYVTLGKVAKADYTPEGLVCDQCAGPVIFRNGWAGKLFLACTRWPQTGCKGKAFRGSSWYPAPFVDQGQSSGSSGAGSAPFVRVENAEISEKALQHEEKLPEVTEVHWTQYYSE